MALIKCKMCGGDLTLLEGQSVVECEYCGSRQTVPVENNEKMLQQFERADFLRRNCEFDKAAGVYEAIVSEFRQESEAYWGLVLCKYGIEYVDDPATGKKIPTCHRSSFDSVMDDPNLEYAQDYADAVARRQYREEAKQLEAIRQGILEVSATEQPYDIFICYKETDENGDRTVDSVMAQNLYSALTDKGYRVFFARVTLREKLGQAYEPYIFAALNSAKVMLAIGTCYEYYNAVWVKNEWSRYLKLMAQDKSRHLIPCYKDIDAYDMPKEFKPLQAVDLGQMGADQDILFNMEKYIPLKKQPLVQERIVVGSTGDNKVASLLDRGNMALEDGDWAKADSFFEDVLNNDSKNAQAYLGKTLAQERCRTLDAFLRKRKEATLTVRSETLKLSPNQDHINQIVNRYTLPGYVEKSDLTEFYKYDLSYRSDVPGRKQQYRDEELYWTNHKQLSRAFQFATGALADTLNSARASLFAELKNRLSQAEKAEAAEKAALQDRYTQHLTQADSRAEALFRNGESRREANYQSLLDTAKNSSDISRLLAAAASFELLGNYLNSADLAAHCRQRAAEEQAKQDEEAERQRLLRAKQLAEHQRQIKKRNTIIAITAAVLLAAFLVVTKVIVPSQNYQKAAALFEAGEYQQANEAFIALGSYKDSAQRADDSWAAYMDEQYAAAMAAMDAGDYDAAIAQLQALQGYQDSQTRIEECEALILEGINRITYQEAIHLFENNEYDAAIEKFQSIADYEDSSAKILEVQQAKSDAANEALYQEAEKILASGDVKKAALAFGAISGYKDAFTRSLDLRDPYFRDTVAVSASYVVGLKNDGTVSVVGSQTGYAPQLMQTVSTWTDVIDIQYYDGTLAALRSDGRVYTSNEKYKLAEEWENVVQIVVGYEELIGLRADGELYSVGTNSYSVAKHTGAYELHKSGNGLYSVQVNGTTVSTYGAKGTSKIDKLSWDDLRMYDNRVRLSDDGTVVGTLSLGTSYSGWKDIVAICQDNSFLVGVKEDGSVLKAGDLACNISGWKNIARIYTIEGYTTDNLIALTKDGRVLKATEKSNFWTFDCSTLTDIRVPYSAIARK